MYIPKYPIVDVHELEDEMHIETDQLFEALRSFYGEWEFEGQVYVYDYLRSKYDSNWDTVPALIQYAHEYLHEYCHLEIGKGFLWLVQ